jgi:ACS family glucarate transporter-like MFS transporter
MILAGGAGVLYIAQSAFWAVTADIAGEYVSVVSGIMNMGGQIGGACTASLTPLIAARFGWETSFATAAGIALIGALAWIAVDPTRQVLGVGGLAVEARGVRDRVMRKRRLDIVDAEFNGG